jgi:hypothetical protein
MRQHLALAATSSVLAGCSLIYSPNGLPAPVIDAPSDAEIILDADPTMLVIDDVAPATIYEGQGESGSQPAIVVLHGHHIIDNNTIVEITPETGAVRLTLGAPVIAKNGNWIAVPVTAHVDPGLAQGTVLALDVTVTETIPPELGGGTATSNKLSGKLTLTGLKELTNTTTPEVTGNSIDTTKLEGRYSQVDLSGIPAVTFVGAMRAIIRSMSSITANALTANGTDGGTSAARGVAGGCDGGAPASTGGCDNTSGGKGGISQSTFAAAGAGGGGGFASDGMSGTGGSAGAGGARTGDELIVTYEGFASQPRNRAGGGGGGGNPLTLGTGGGGGAGGGSIELTARGDVSVGAISARGGLGGPGTAGGGGGGGGAGGLVMLRAEGSLASGMISVLGGNGNDNGGTGSGGRVRWDVPNGTPPTLETGTGPSPTRHRGPAFTLTTRIFRTPYAMISLVGTPNDRFHVYSTHAGVTSAGQQGVSMNPDGTAMFMQTLQQGFTSLCITLEGGQQGTSEADKCIDVAFLP